MANDLPKDHEPNWAKLAAHEEKKTLDEIRQSLWSEHTHLFRWLTASLLAINGGAAIALLNAESLTGNTQLVSGGLFTMGILAALLIGVFGQRATQNTLPKLQKLAGYWLAVSSDGIREETLENDLIADLNRVGFAGHASRIAGWISAILFACGVLVIGADVGQKEEANGESTSQRRLDSE